LPNIGKIGFNGFFPIHGVKIGRFFLEEGRANLGYKNVSLDYARSTFKSTSSVVERHGKLDELELKINQLSLFLL
jgi:hypothetical protein